LTKDSLIVRKEFLKDTLQSIVTYRKDTLIKEGKATYYEHGKSIEEMYYSDNKLAGSHLIYDETGLKLYICHDSYGDTVFLRKYKGKEIVFETGKILPHGVLSDSHFETDGTITYASFIVKPPFTKIWINSFLINLNNNDTIKPIGTEVNYDWGHYYTFKVISNNQYKYYQCTYFIDSLKNPSKLIRIIDTVFYNSIITKRNEKR